MKKDIFATNNKFWSAKRANHPNKKKEHFSQWKPICDTIHTKKSNKTNNKIHTLDEEEEEEECMSVRARVKNLCQEVCPQREVVPGSSEIKKKLDNAESRRNCGGFIFESKGKV